MALIIEDGSIVENANSYVTLTEARDSRPVVLLNSLEEPEGSRPAATDCEQTARLSSLRA